MRNSGGNPPLAGNHGVDARDFLGEPVAASDFVITERVILALLHLYLCLISHLGAIYLA